MTAPVDAWTAISTGQVDPDSPIDTTLMSALRGNDRHLREVLYGSGSGTFFTPQIGHDHDGVNSPLLGADVVTAPMIAPNTTVKTIDFITYTKTGDTIFTIVAIGVLPINVDENTLRFRPRFWTTNASFIAECRIRIDGVNGTTLQTNATVPQFAVFDDFDVSGLATGSYLVEVELKITNGTITATLQGFSLALIG